MSHGLLLGKRRFCALQIATRDAADGEWPAQVLTRKSYRSPSGLSPMRDWARFRSRRWGKADGLSEDRVHAGKSVGESGRTGLKDDGGGDVEDMFPASGRGAGKAGAGEDPLAVHLHSAPGRQDDLGIARGNRLRSDHPVL